MTTNPHSSPPAPASLAPVAGEIGKFSKARELSKRIGVHPKSLFRWADAGLIGRHKINQRLVLFSENEVLAFIQSARVGAKP